jgi:hypothetical protein
MRLPWTSMPAPWTDFLPIGTVRQVNGMNMRGREIFPFGPAFLGKQSLFGVFVRCRAAFAFNFPPLLRQGGAS